MRCLKNLSLRKIRFGLLLLKEMVYFITDVTTVSAS